MANRIPLIIDSTSKRIKELPSGDNLDLTGNGISAVRDIIPETDVTYNLGSATKRWNSLYVSGNTIFVGTASISVNASNIQIGIGANTATIPVASSQTFATLSGSETLTNKTINLANNTLTATSAQILAAVSDETGSGVLVFNTSPTLVTPILGTPQSVTLTNATGLPVSTGISGLGTGVATFLATPSSANLAAALTDETGSGSVVFSASPTFTGTANFAAIGTTGNATVGGNLTVTGDFIVNGTTTTVNSTTITVDDINIELGSVATPTDITANGGGITLKGTTDKTISWSSIGWTSSEDFNLATGKSFEINGTSVLSSTTLGSGVINSSLTSVGTIATGTWQGTIVSPTYGGTGVNNGTKTITLGGNLTTSGAFNTTLTATANTTVTLPTTGTLSTLAGTETLTNKTIAAGSNTISGLTNANLSGSAGITNANLANSSITVGNTAISLGASSTTLAGLTSVTSTSFVGALTGNASTATTLATARAINGVNFDGSAAITITANTTNGLTIGTGLSGTSFNGSSAVTIAIDSTVATLTGTQTLTNKSLGGFDQKTGSTSIANNAVAQASVATITQTAVDTFAAATYRSAKYVIQITQGSNYQVEEILVIHNGTTTTLTNYAVMNTNGILGTFATDISAGNVRLLVTMNSATAATINITRTTIVV